MIDQKDIDRLLAGRKIIDGIKKPDSETLNILHTTAKISTKETVTASVEYDARVAKAEIATLLETEKQSILDAEKALTEIGFSSQSDFFKFNEQMVLEELTRCVDITWGKGCSSCPTKKCVELFGNGACGVRETTPTKVENSLVAFCLSLFRKSSDRDNFSDVTICPDGYGLHGKGVATERFDLGWR